MERGFDVLRRQRCWLLLLLLCYGGVEDRVGYSRSSLVSEAEDRMRRRRGADVHVV